MLSAATGLAQRRVRRRQAGFTLVEILVAMTLLGILTTIALPSFTGWIRNTQVRTVAEALQNGLRVAQSEALRRSMQVVFYRTDAAITTANIGNGTSSSQPNFAYAAAGVNWVVLTAPTFGSSTPIVEFVQGGSLGSAAAATTLNDPGPVCFDANGRIATNAPSTLPTGVACTTSTTPLIFKASQPAPADRELWVQISSGGRVRMCDPKRTLSPTAPDGC